MTYIFVLILFLIYIVLGGVFCKLCILLYDWSDSTLGEFERYVIGTSPNISIMAWPILLIMLLIEIIVYFPCEFIKWVFNI